MADPNAFTLNTSSDSLMLKMLNMGFRGVAGLTSPTVSVRLSNTTPAANDSFSTVTTNELAASNGYSTMTATFAAPSYNGGNSRFQMALTGTLPTFTASGGDVTFQYAYITVSDSDEDYVYGYLSWASAETVADGAPFTLNTLGVNLGEEGTDVGL